jgi:tether containing UBX domain for GLUT4
MASHVEVITTDLRRAKVQVQPSMTLSEVLDKACQTLKLPRDDYLLKYEPANDLFAGVTADPGSTRHKNKQLDLLSQFRISGLGSGAKLELIKRSSSPSVVSVALQFSTPEPSVPGGRLTDRFPSDLTLWKVLRQFESSSSRQGRNVNITARGVPQTSDGGGSGSGQLFYETPVLNVLGREFASVSDLSRTLSQVGITSGSVLLRLSFRKTDQTLFDAMKDISQYFDQTEASKPLPEGAEVAVVPSLPNGKLEEKEERVTEPQSASIPAELAASATAPQPPTSDGEDMEMTSSLPLSDPLQPVGVFLAPTSAIPAAAAFETPESEFEPSIAHAQLHQSRLQMDSRNKRLKSDKELAAEAAAADAKVAAVKSIDVRVRFPDNTMAQWKFDNEVTGATLFAAVRSVSARAGEPFKLVLPGGQGSITDSADEQHKLIKGYRLKGAVLLSLHWEDEASSTARSQPFLREQVAVKAQHVKLPEAPQVIEDEQRPQPIKVDKTEEKSGDGSGKKLPKWLKLPGKK